MKQKEIKRREKHKKLKLKRCLYLVAIAQQENQFIESIKTQEAIRPTFNRDAFQMQRDTEQNVEDNAVLNKRTNEKSKSVGFDRSMWKITNE